jgi:hypothetical protein
MSTKRFHAEFGGGSLSRVNKNFKVLEDEGWLRYIRSEGPGGDRRGGVEHFYRATEPAFFDQETWGLMPYSIRMAVGWNIFGQVAPRLRGALEGSKAGGGDTRDLTCTQFLLDECGWKRAIEAVTAHFVGPHGLLSGTSGPDSQGRGLSGDRLGVEPPGNERDTVPP